MCSKNRGQPCATLARAVCVAKQCSIKDCNNPHEGKGLCKLHYRRQRRSGGLDRTPKQYLREYNRTRHGRFVQLCRAARDTGLPLGLDEQDHGLLLFMPCEYCGGWLPETGHGMDRKDPLKGYTLENVVPCCTSCNRIKNRYLTYEEMKAAMIAVLKVRNKNGN